MPSSFEVCVIVYLIASVVLQVVLAIRVDQLTIIKNQLYKILDNVRPLDSSIQSVWSTIIDIRKDTGKITGLLNKDEEESEENADILDDGWTTAPCPVCGGPAYMDYSLPEGDGYCVMCGRNADAHGHCDYGTVAGGPTRKIAALMWNKSVMVYCNNKNAQTMNDAEET